MVTSLPVYGQYKSCAKIQFQEEVHDFDTIIIDANSYSCIFYFTNTGSAPLFINDVLSSCGCTVAEWSTNPIMPEKKGSITVKYNAAQLGSFVKTILVKSNANNNPKVALQIKGYVKEMAQHNYGMPMQ
ncbi:MAG: DUF1573 domain-containing protein [Bacteroidales bacterium]|nr:DUF1573 domain-containing protein [Candidatus Colimorpha merdihippi]